MIAFRVSVIQEVPTGVSSSGAKAVSESVLVLNMQTWNKSQFP